MNIYYIIRTVGLFLITFSLSLLPPIAIAVWYQENTIIVFVLALLLTLLLGLLLWSPLRLKNYEPLTRDGFLIVVIIWGIMCIIGMLPFLLITYPKISIVDALFESISGLTTTGATILTDLDYLPKSLLYYRQQLQFLGGMGIILLAIAILPTLGIGGLQLFRAELATPMKDNKLMPHIAQSAKMLWTIYVSLHMLCIICYWAAGMQLFDAVCYSFGTVSTGGFTIHDQSIGYFQSSAIQLTAIIFMFLGSINFSLHFLAIHNNSIKYYLRDLELKTFIFIIVLCTIMTTCVLHNAYIFEDLFTSCIQSLFHIMSLITTTGLTCTTFHLWPSFVPTLLLLLLLIGGCSGSTSGGIKIIRLLLLFKQAAREIKQLVHPNAYYIIKFGNTPVSSKVSNSIWGFLSVYLAIFALFLIALSASGLDFFTAFAALSACISNTGASLGKVAANYQQINDSTKLILTIAMLIGRLEFFTILVLFMPDYWQN